MCVCVYWHIHSKIDQPIYRWRVFLVTTTRNAVEDTYIGYLRLIIRLVFVGSTPFSHTLTQCVYISEIIVTKTVSRRRRPVYNIFASFRLSGAVASPNGIQTVFDTTIIIIFSRARWDIYTMRRDEMHRHRHRHRSTTSNDAFFEYFYSFARYSSLSPSLHKRVNAASSFRWLLLGGCGRISLLYFMHCIYMAPPPLSTIPL